MSHTNGRTRIHAALPLLVVLVAGAAGLARAQDASTDSGAEDELRFDSIAEFQTRVYKIRPKKLWRGLLRVLEEQSFPPEEIDEEERVVKTSFVDFEAKDYPDEVVEPAPTFSPERHILTLKKLRMGKVSMEAGVRKVDGGTELRVRARILVNGMDRKRMAMVLVDRRSSGVIESVLRSRLEEALGIAPIGG